jgi:hypothetical protein
MASKLTKHRPVIWEKTYLSALAQTGNMTLSAQMAGISRGTAQERYQTSPEFRKACDDAINQGIDILEAEARRRAMGGSDLLLIFLLKAHRPDKYRDNYHVTTSNAPTTYTIDLGLPDDTPQLKDAQSGEVLER